MQKFGWVISLVICVVLGSFFGYLYFHDHSWGAAGDDSAGYIFLWGLLDQHKPLVYQEPLTVKALDFFQEEKLARWTTPTHHEIISPAGYIASKYPIGLSLLMHVFSSLFQSDAAIYYVMPFFAVLNIILLYLIANIIFKDIKWKYFFSLLAALVMGLANLYLTQTVSQPMREIPSIFFILSAFYLLLLAIESRRHLPARPCQAWQAGEDHKGREVLFYFLLFLSAALIGFSFNIRETSLIVIPAFILLFWKLNFKFKKKMALLAISAIFLLVGALPSVINSYNISIHKEKFKKKDISSVAITSNFDHIRSFSIDNLFQNNGKFRPDSGGLAYYWEIMQKMSAWPIFLALVFVGFIFLYRQDKFMAYSLVLWGISILLLFSLWINPYNRYLLPAFPVLAILGSYGLFCLLTKIVPYFFTVKKYQISVSMIVVLSLIVCYQPVIAELFNPSDTEEQETRSLGYSDSQALKKLGQDIKNDSQDKEPLIIFSGNWQYGISETFSAHTGIQAIRMPLEQKFDFKEAEVLGFFNNMMEDHQIYIWMDDTTDIATLDFINNFSKTEKLRFDLIFDNNEIIIYALTTKD